MKKIVFIFSIAVLLISCAHKKTAIIDEPVVKEETNGEIILLYNRLIAAIKQRDYETIASCYSDDAVYGYGYNRYGLKTGAKSQQIVGRDNIVAEYDYLFKKRYLTNIEYDIMELNNKTKPYSIKFFNVWENTDFGVFHNITIDKLDNKYFITVHEIKE